jgi:hypothetical protein
MSSLDYDSIAFTRVGNTTTDEIRFRHGKAVQIARIIIVPGKTLTITTGGMTANNKVLPGTITICPTSTDFPVLKRTAFIVLPIRV